ncbi:MAG: hypothetical protein H0V72_27930 [Bradyrhizobium sp.]|nr:hypothetical protein [Bradyrhizobium sp.]
MVQWIIREFPVPKDLAKRLPGLLERLLEQEVLLGQVVEYVHDDEVRPELAAFGLSGILSQECAAAYLGDPVPHFELVLLDRALRGGPRLRFSPMMTLPMPMRVTGSPCSRFFGCSAGPIRTTPRRASC